MMISLVPYCNRCKGYIEGRVKNNLDTAYDVEREHNYSVHNIRY